MYRAKAKMAEHEAARQMRYRAARFYYKALDGWMTDWISSGEEPDWRNPPVDWDDVKDLYALLVDTFEEGVRSTSPLSE